MYLHQGKAIRQARSPSSLCQRFAYAPFNENFKAIQNSGFLPDHPQNLTTSRLWHARHTLKISERSVHNFLSYLVHTQTNRQTHRQTNKNRQKHYLLSGGKQRTLQQNVGIYSLLFQIKIEESLLSMCNITITRSVVFFLGGGRELQPHFDFRRVTFYRGSIPTLPLGLLSTAAVIISLTLSMQT